MFTTRWLHQSSVCSRKHLIRAFSTLELKNGINMAYDLHAPPENASTSNNGAPIVFVHGFLGSKTNNRSMSKVFARELNRSVYAIDLRNHGDSSHSQQHDYGSLASDVECFIQQMKLEKPILIGHSMGAKAVMAVALRKEVEIGSLIPVDNAPVDAALKTNFHDYVKAMQEIEKAQVQKQSEADAILQKYESALPIRQFLLTNLTRKDGQYQWRVPLKWLAMSLDKMGDFPFTNPDEIRYEGPTLMVRGTKSPYVADEMLPIVGRFFPKFELRDIDAGHWVISEKPEEFRSVVVEWLQDKE